MNKTPLPPQYRIQTPDGQTRRIRVEDSTRAYSGVMSSSQQEHSQVHIHSQFTDQS